MQHFKNQYSDPGFKGSFANIQSCLRTDDLSEINDGNHLLYFEMIGLFSFRSLSLEFSIEFFREFLRRLNIVPDYVTVHPNKSDWKQFYLDLPVKEDLDCIWSDGGEIGGYCTEFYYQDLEIGNIVNPLGDCLDVGFGLDRLIMVLSKDYVSTEETVLRNTIVKLLESGLKPSGKKHGYILKKLIKQYIKLEKEDINYPEYFKEKQNLEKIRKLVERIYLRNKDKTDQWWRDTHGIDIKEFLN
jgi:alanyl-tRNA synthetase